MSSNRNHSDLFIRYTIAMESLSQEEGELVASYVRTPGYLTCQLLSVSHTQ